jgi:queuosine biosynthesis protein QueD
MTLEADIDRSMPYAASFNRTFQAAHRLTDDDSKCSRIHGHNFTLNVSIWGNALDKTGFVINYYCIKEIVDALDHRLIVNEKDPFYKWILHEKNERRDANAPPLDWFVPVPFNPTTENMAQWFAWRIGGEALVQNPELRRLHVVSTLVETENISASGQWMFDRDEPS